MIIESRACLCARRFAEVTGMTVAMLFRSQSMMDGSKIKAMESAASYQGSTNPDTTFV
jgi:hypothetical protein